MSQIIKNKLIERGIALRTIVDTQFVADKNRNELNDLNSRLEEKLGLLKVRKAENDKLEHEIQNYKKNYQTTGNLLNKSKLGVDLFNARRMFGNVSDEKAIHEIRLKRARRQCETLNLKINEEIELQSNDKIKIENLQIQIEEANDEINELKEELKSKEDSLLLIIKKNSNLSFDVSRLADERANAFEKRISLNIDIQSLNEKMKFESALFNLMKKELERLQQFENDEKKIERFYEKEFRKIKEKIRDDYMKINEDNNEAVRHEYEFRYKKMVERVEKQEAEANMSRDLTQENSFNKFKIEFAENEAEISSLKKHESELLSKLDMLADKLKNSRENFEINRNSKDNEIEELDNKLKQLKMDSWNLLRLTKNLDKEISIYGQLLIKQFDKCVNEIATSNRVISTDFFTERYKNMEYEADIDESRFQRLDHKWEHNHEVINQERFICKSTGNKFSLQKMRLIDEELLELRKHELELEKRRRERLEDEKHERQREQERLKKEELERQREQERLKKEELERQREQERLKKEEKDEWPKEIETQAYGDYIIFMSSKTVNLNGWYLHCHGPNEHLYKFTHDVWIKNGDKLRIWCKNSADKIVSTMEFLDTIADNIDTWNMYNEYSVTKLVDGFEKELLTNIHLTSVSSNRYPYAIN